MFLGFFFPAPSTCGIVNKSVGSHKSSGVLSELTLCTARMKTRTHKHFVIRHLKSVTFSTPAGIWETCLVATFQVHYTTQFHVRGGRGGCWDVKTKIFCLFHERIALAFTLNNKRDLWVFICRSQLALFKRKDFASYTINTEGSVEMQVLARAVSNPAVS